MASYPERFSRGVVVKQDKPFINDKYFLQPLERTKEDMERLIEKMNQANKIQTELAERLNHPVVKAKILKERTPEQKVRIQKPINTAKVLERVVSSDKIKVDQTKRNLFITAPAGRVFTQKQLQEQLRAYFYGGGKHEQNSNAKRRAGI